MPCLSAAFRFCERKNIMIFTSDFPGGNGKLLGFREDGDKYEISFIAESKAREPQPLWFWFRLSELGGKGARIRFANSVQTLGGPNDWPINQIVFRADGGDWKRLDTRENIWNEKRSLETYFILPSGYDNVELAFCYPYLENDLLKTVSECGAFDEAVIGYSAMGRPMRRFTTSYGDDERTKHGVYLIARQHSGEVTGSLVLDGMLRRIAERPELRNVAWWTVPMADIDGVCEGFYGKDQVYGDFNRAWHQQFPNRQEIFAVEQDIEMWRRYTQGDIVIDLHSPSHGEYWSYFVISGDTPDDIREWERRLNDRMNARLEAAGYEKSGFREQAPETNTSAKTGLSCAQLMHSRGVKSFTYEFTYQGEGRGKRFYTKEDYRVIGESLADSLYEMLTE